MAQLPGYTRGLTFIGPYAFIGLSKIRERSVFGGLPIEERRADLRCGIRVVDTRSGQVVAGLDFHSGVEEIFAVEALPGVRSRSLDGPESGGRRQRDHLVCPKPHQMRSSRLGLAVPPNRTCSCRSPRPSIRSRILDESPGLAGRSDQPDRSFSTANPVITIGVEILARPPGAFDSPHELSSLSQSLVRRPPDSASPYGPLP